MFDFAVGGIDVDLVADQDRLFDMYLEIQSGVGVLVDKDGVLDLSLDNRPRFITVEASLATAPEALDRGDIAALLRMMVPSVLGEMDVLFQGFAIPSLDVGELGDSLEQFQGRQVTFVPQNFSTIGDDAAFLLVEGTVQELNAQ